MFCFPWLLLTSDPSNSPFLKKLITLVHLFLAVRGLRRYMGFSLVVVSRAGAAPQLQRVGFSLWWLPLCSTGFGSCGTWAQQLQLLGSRALAK